MRVRWRGLELPSRVITDPKFKNETFGGLTPPLTFVRDQPAPKASCWFYVTVKNNKMTAPQGNTPLCR